MAKNAKLQMSTAGFDGLIKRLNSLGNVAESAAIDALNQVGDKIAEDLKNAIEKQNLPAEGEFSRSNTGYAQEAENIERSEVITVGTAKEMEIGFAGKSAAPFLIYGTPNFEPVPELNRIFTSKAYANERSGDVGQVLEDHLRRAMK